MIEIFGGILLAILIVVFLRDIVAAIIWIACATLAVGGVGLAVWWLSHLGVGELIALAAVGMIIVVASILGVAKRRHRARVPLAPGL